MEINLTQGDANYKRAVDSELTKPRVKHRFTFWLALFMVCLPVALFLAGLFLVLLVPAASRGLRGYESNYQISFILLFYSFLGAAIAIRHSKNPIGWIFGAIGVSGGFEVFGIGYLVYSHYYSPDNYQIPLQIFPFLLNVWVTQNAFGTLAYLLFPDGKLLSSRWRLFAWFPLFMGVAMYLLATPAPIAGIPAASFQSPLAFLVGGIIPWSPGTITAVYAYLNDAMFIIASIGVVFRLRQAKGDQREQMKWCVYAGAVSAVILVGLSISIRVPIIHALDPGAYNTNMMFFGIPADISILIIPVAIFLAMSKYRLYDIDLVINRTLVYVPLTAILAGLYSGSITLSQRLFIATTGQKSDAAVVMSTLILAATFTPIKNSLQNSVDKRFKEPKDPLKELKAFGKQVEAVSEVLNTRHITHRLLDMTVAAYHASFGAIYSRRDGKKVLEHTFGEWKEGTEAVSLPMIKDGVQLGSLLLGARNNHKDYTVADRETLQHEVDRVAEMIWLTQAATRDERQTLRKEYYDPDE